MSDLKYEVNGVKLRFQFEPSNHMWFIFKDSESEMDFRNCLMRVSKVKGDTILKFLDTVKVAQSQERL